MALAALCSPAIAADDFSGSYACIAEFGGGVAYDHTAQQWEGTVFRPNSRYVLRIAKLADVETFKGSGDFIGSYTAFVNDFGSTSDPTQCFGNDPNGNVTLWAATVVCGSNLTSYHVNLRTMRFLAIYAVGYIDGADNRDNTPSIMAGTCTKIS